MSLYPLVQGFEQTFEQTQWGKAKSKHLKGRLVPRVSDAFGSQRDLVVFLFLDTF